MLIANGQGMTTEMYDLGNTECNKRGPPIFPVEKFNETEIDVGGIIKETPIVCGSHKSSDENEARKSFCQILKCGVWQQGPELTTPRIGASAVVLKDKLWITGGYFDKIREPLRSTELVSFDKSEPFVDLPIDVRGHCITQVNNREIILIGGYSSHVVSVANDHISKATYIFNIQSKTWKQIQDLRVERRDHGCAVFRFDSTKVVVVAGGSSLKSSARTSVEFLRMDSLYKGWKIGPKLPWHLMNFPLVASPTGTSLLALGGEGRSDIVERNRTVLEMKCGKSLKDCQWKALPEKLTSARSGSVAMWLPKSLDLCYASKNVQNYILTYSIQISQSENFFQTRVFWLLADVNRGPQSTLI